MCIRDSESGLPFPTQGDLPDPEIEPESPVAHALPGGFFTTESPGKPVDSVVAVSYTHLDVYKRQTKESKMQYLDAISKTTE